MFTLDNIISLAKLQFKLDIDGIHGINHWLTVLKNANEIAETNGADYQVITLFSIFHDCCRLTDKEDPEHGIRAAQYIKLLEIKLNKWQHNLLEFALKSHSLNNMTTTDATIGTCWDADRLDLFRVGISPNYEDMSTLKGIEMLSKITNKPQPDFITEMSKKPEIAAESDLIFLKKNRHNEPTNGKISTHRIFK